MDNRQDISKGPDQERSATQGSDAHGLPPEDLAARFGEWAGRALQDEAPPRGVAAEILAQVLQEDEITQDSDNPADAYGLWSAMTALTQEIKLQGRAFKQLHDALAARVDPDGPSRDRQEDVLVLLRQLAGSFNAEKADRERDIRMEAERKARKELLDVLLDLRDRLIRGNRNDADPEAFAPTWLDRLLGRAPSLKRLAESQAARQAGYRMSLERLEEVLNQHGVREIPCEGHLFDPRSMNAIDLEETDEHPDGQVLEVYQTGYEWNGRVLRTAQVRVARRPAGALVNETGHPLGEPED